MCIDNGTDGQPPHKMADRARSRCSEVQLHSPAGEEEPAVVELTMETDHPTTVLQVPLNHAAEQGDRVTEETLKKLIRFIHTSQKIHSNTCITVNFLASDNEVKSCQIYLATQDYSKAN